MSIQSTIDFAAAASFQPLSAGGRVKLDRKVVQVSASRGQTGRSVQFSITNVGTGYLRFDTNSFKFTGTDAAQFTVVGGLPMNIPPGKRRSFTIALKPNSSAPVDRVLTAILNLTQTGASTASAALAVRGLATTGEAGDKEPSLARILELFQYDINDGDSDPNTTELTISGATDQVSAPRFEKASGGTVNITPVAQFVTRGSGTGGRIGIYQPGNPQDRTELFSMSGADSQTVNPAADGTTSFDPGKKQFSLWGEATTYNDGAFGRYVYGEDALNTWEPVAANTNKVRVYPFKQNGVVVPNTYLVAFEEYQLSNDQNDFVFIISNVAISNSQPELGLIAQEGQPDADRLAFNRIETVDATFGNRVKDISKVRIVNTGNQDLVLSDITLHGSAFQFQNNVPSTLTLKRNQTYDLTVKFRASGGDTYYGSVTFNSNDRDEPTKTIALTGFWQSDSEQTAQGIQQEPTLPELVNLLGYKTQILKQGQLLSHGGAVEAIGDEVLAGAWKAADPGQQVSIQDLAVFHSQGNIDQVAWYPEGHPWYGSTDPRNTGSNSGDANVIVQNRVDDGQSILPRKVNSDSLMIGTFRPGTQTFGLRVNKELSDDELNLKLNTDLGGHHMRFFPAKDANNNIIPDTYLVAVDFNSINFDYNDHLLLVKNIRPSDRPGSVHGLYGSTSGGGNTLAWESVPGAVGYAVYRAVKPGDAFVRVTADVLNTTTFNDSRAPKNATRYYEVAAIFSNGKIGTPSAITGIRRA